MDSGAGAIAIKEKFCQNCKRDVPSNNFDMHSVHCERNIKFCESCGEPVPKSEWENHKNDVHAEVACEKCSRPIEKRYLDKHFKDDCKYRPTECRHCDMALPLYKMYEHESFCGSRTEKCPMCNKYVKVRDLESHVCAVEVENKSEGTWASREVEVPSGGRAAGGSNLPMDGWVDEPYTFMDSIRQRQVVNDSFFSERSREECKFCGMTEDVLRMSVEEHLTFCPQQLVSCKYCPEKVQILNLEIHEASCSGRVECPYCSQCISPDNRTHINGCPFSIDSGVGSSQPQYESLSLATRHPNVNVTEGFEELRVDDSSINNDQVQLPCEFCHELFDLDSLIQHQTSCASGPDGVF